MSAWGTEGIGRGEGMETLNINIKSSSHRGCPSFPVSYPTTLLSEYKSIIY